MATSSKFRGGGGGGGAFSPNKLRRTDVKILIEVVTLADMDRSSSTHEKRADMGRAVSGGDFYFSPIR